MIYALLFGVVVFFCVHALYEIGAREVSCGWD